MTTSDPVVLPVDLPVDLIDTHQHLILRGRLRYGWTAGVPTLAGTFDRQDYAAEVAGRGVVATLFMETGVDDADYRAEARLVAGMIGQGDLPMLGQIAACRPETETGFEEWLEECRGLHVVGLRRLMQTMPDAMSGTESYRRNIRRIGAMGWPVDLCLAARQLGLAADLVRACPDVTFVLDHLGTNDMAPGGFDAWRAGLSQLAGRDNVRAKLSGVSAYVPADVAVADVVAVGLDLFGPDRMLWGGDWPVVNLGLGLPGWIDVTRGLLAHLSGAEQARIGHLNARAVYGLPEPVARQDASPLRASNSRNRPE